MAPEPLTGPRRGPDHPRIPGYRVEGVLGRGATGVVYRARQLAVDREVALKVLHPELARNRRIVQRLQREARTTARLAHPHIVTAIDMGETEGRWWYAMELVDGPSLALVLRQEGRLREREALRLFIPLCEALEHVFEHGIVHRDIKPANILIDRTGGARLADLGLAFAIEDPSLTGQGGTLGTPHYISPEQAVDPGSADVRSDLWSFGATLYHAVCGRPPFDGETTAEVLSGVLYARVVDPLEHEPGLSKGLCLVLRKCLTRKPAERYQTPRELLLDLERVRERRPPRIRRRRLDPLARQGSPLSRAALVLGLAVVGLGGAWWITTRLGGTEETSPAGEVAALQPFGPLEDLARSMAASPARFGAHVRGIEELEPDVPEANRPRWRELEHELRTVLRAQVGTVLTEAEAEVDRALDRGDFVAARGTLEGQLPQRIGALTGFTLGGLEERFGWFRNRIQLMRTQVDTQERTGEEELRAVLDEHERHVLDEVGRLEQEQRWRSARELLAVDDDDLLGAVGFGGWRFPGAIEERLFGDIRIRLGVRSERVRYAWSEIDRGLRLWIRRREDTLMRQLGAREIRVGAPEELERAFEAELFDRNLEREEMPVELSRLALDELEAARARLADREEDLHEGDARDSLELAEGLCTKAWGERDYEGALSLWLGFREELERMPGDPSSPWRAEVGRRASVRVEEARLLIELLERASAEIGRIDGRTRQMRVRSGITTEGRVVSGIDPLAHGFELVPERGEPFQLDLRTLSARDVEELALPEPRDEISPHDRLMLSAFRRHEGNPSSALQVLRGGPLPSRGIAHELALDLKLRLIGEIESIAQARGDREEEARRWFDPLSSVEYVTSYPENSRKRVDLLLREFADTELVRERRDELKAIRSSLRDRDRDFREVFRPDAIELPRAGRVRMVFSFDSDRVGSWELQDGRFDAVGWTLEASVHDWDAFAKGWGARLICRDPLDVEGADFDVTLDFELVDETAPPQLLIVSTVGFHVALTGPGLPGGDGRSRWLVGTGPLPGFLRELRGGAGTVVPVLLAQGGRHELRIVASRRRREVELTLDGVVLGRKHLLRLSTDQRSILVRSWDPLLLLQAVVEGGRR